MLNEDGYRRSLIERALRRSYVKRKVVQYLSTHGYGYMSEIAHHTSVAPTNVCGAIRGMKNRYVEGNSLLDLGVISETDTGNNKNEKIKIYCLTALGGRDAVDICKRLDKETNF